MASKPETEKGREQARYDFGAWDTYGLGQMPRGSYLGAADPAEIPGHLYMGQATSPSLIGDESLNLPTCFNDENHLETEQPQTTGENFLGSHRIVKRKSPHFQVCRP